MTTIELSAVPRRARKPAHPLAIALDAAGVTITDAALVLGICRTWLSPILNGKANPGPELAAKMDALAAALAEEGVSRAGI